jgi:heat shock protein HslJ
MATAQPSATPTERAVQHGALPADLEGREWQISQFYLHDILLWPHRGIVWTPRPNITLAGGLIKGSPGCGKFTGTYQRSDDRLAISATWTDDTKSPCNADEKDDAAKILQALANVRQIGGEPAYWHSGSLLLKNESGKIQITLSPMHSGQDLAEFHDTFWHLNKLEGATSDLSSAVIIISGSEITLSAPAYTFDIPFQYGFAGLEFQTRQPSSDSTYKIYAAYISQQSITGQQVIREFQNVVQRTSSYQFTQGLLTFFDKDHQSLLVLSSIPPTGVENRLWRISKMRGGSAPPDADGLSEKNEPAWIILVNGRVTGSPGCGGFAGTYSLSGDTVTWQVGVIIAGLCPGLDLPYVPPPKEVHPYSGTMQIEKKADGVLLRDRDGYAQILLIPAR